jgi:hypothetical protein
LYWFRPGFSANFIKPIALSRPSLRQQVLGSKS